MHKDLRRLIAHLQHQGLTVERTKSNHFVVRGPDGRRIATLSGTPSDPRAAANATAYIRRAGYSTKP